ncbi:MAG: matrixin family metalloprotease [Myxococcales bacterium]|nr:matrixin family metalloprotease [Myxococcales bacterium]
MISGFVQILAFTLVFFAVIRVSLNACLAIPELNNVDAALARFMELSPTCSDTVDICVPIVLYVTQDQDGFSQTPEWFADQLRVAQTHFALINIGFQLYKVVQLPEETTRNGIVKTKDDRDRLGEGGRYNKGVIAVFLVHELHDVDKPGVIRGVHWRHRSRPEQRWVIVSKIAPFLVLAHELGHFFGLPHSKETGSLMNKTPRELPPSTQWTFTAKEQKHMRGTVKAMLRSGIVKQVDR